MPRVCLMESLTAVCCWDCEGGGGTSKIVGPGRMKRGRICVLCILIYNPSLFVDSSRSNNKKVLEKGCHVYDLHLSEKNIVWQCVVADCYEKKGC